PRLCGGEIHLMDVSNYQPLVSYMVTTIVFCTGGTQEHVDAIGFTMKKTHAIRGRRGMARAELDLDKHHGDNKAGPKAETQQPVSSAGLRVVVGEEEGLAPSQESHPLSVESPSVATPGTTELALTSAPTTPKWPTPLKQHG
ncbi:MAG: hypothetical protein L3J38_07115, partial [Thiomicrorhabdus sp.]|nr:hypothetical protein [Thiomicrorhabdus sp.]